MLGRKLRSGTSKTKELVPVQPDFPWWSCLAENKVPELMCSTNCSKFCVVIVVFFFSVKLLIERVLVKK